MINKLIAKIKETGAPIVVGLDPMMKYIPEQIKKKAFAEYGETLEGAAEAVFQYNKEIVDHIHDLVPAVKPQIAMYEQFGIPGLVAFKRTVDYCKEKGLVVIGDVKRGDIGSTSEAYAVGHLGKVQVVIPIMDLMRILQQSIPILDQMVSSLLSKYVRKKRKAFSFWSRRLIQAVESFRTESLQTQITGRYMRSLESR